MDSTSYNRQCTICDSYFPSRVSLAQHTKKHEESFEHRCTYCDMGPYSLKFLRDHERSHVNPPEEDDGYRIEQRCTCCEFGLFWTDDPAKSEEHALVGDAWTDERRCRFCPFGPGIEKLIRDHEARHEEFEDEEVLKEEEEADSDDDDEVREIQSDDDEITEVYNGEDGDEDYDDDDDDEDDEIEVLPEPSNNVEVIEEDEIEEVYPDEEVEEVTSDDEIQEIHKQEPSEDLNNSIIFDFDDSLFEEPSHKKEEKMVIKQSNIDDDEGIEAICNVKGIRISERRPELISKQRNFKTKDNFERNAKAKEVPQKFNHKTSNMFTEDDVPVEPSNRRRSKGKAQNQRNASIGTIVELNGPTAKDDDFISVIEEDEIGGKDEALKLKRQEFEKQPRWARIDDKTRKHLMKITGEGEDELKVWFNKTRQLQKFNSE